MRSVMFPEASLRAPAPDRSTIIAYIIMEISRDNMVPLGIADAGSYGKYKYIRIHLCFRFEF